MCSLHSVPNNRRSVFGPQHTSGGPPAAVWHFNPVQQLRSCRDEPPIEQLSWTEGEEGDRGGSTE